MNLIFYRCEICGKIIAVISDSGVPTVCCGQNMHELIPGETDGAAEKHVPVFSVGDNSVTVQVGSVLHPMIDSHLIEWIALQTDKAFTFRELHRGYSPETSFCIRPDEKIENVYAYCNLHGLWHSGREK